MQEGIRFALKRKTLLIRGAALLIPLCCTLLLLTQTAFAQNTYVITDGSRVAVHTTAVTDPEAVLDEAGFTLGENDTYTTLESGGISEITVQRSAAQKPVEVARVSETYTDVIPHQTTYCSDPNLPRGMRTVLTDGKDGQMVCTANVVYENGVETSRTVLSRTVTGQPVDEVVAVGTGVSAASADYAQDTPLVEAGTIRTESGEMLTYTDAISVLATAYTCDGYAGTTATGTTARVGAVAVDPSVIPLGSRLFIVSDDGQYVYGVATAEDTGGLIVGNRVDLYFNTVSECIEFGARGCTVYILG